MTDLVLDGIGELVTNRPGAGDLVGAIADAAVVVRDGRIVWAGRAADLPRIDGAESIDLEGRAVIPGFVDAHTHLVFAGDRAGEFARRLRGDSYEDILASGGGIHSTVRTTSRAGVDDLVTAASGRARRMLSGGTTTVEVKSGYALDGPGELRMLAAASAVAEETGIGVVATYLAHVVPPGVDRAVYVDEVVEEILPACAPLAHFADVFCDRGAFTVAEAERILIAAAGLGLGLRIHAEQLSRTGAAALAARLGAASADHLDHVTADDAAALAASGTTAVLLPAAALSMRSPQPPGRMLWDAGVTVALATDCNPGTSYTESMSLVVALACLEMGLTPEEALWAATSGGAASLRRPDLGAIVVGAAADLAVLDAPSYTHIPYRPGTDLVARVMKAGVFVA